MYESLAYSAYLRRRNDIALLRMADSAHSFRYVAPLRNVRILDIAEKVYSHHETPASAQRFQKFAWRRHKMPHRQAGCSPRNPGSRAGQAQFFFIAEGDKMKPVRRAYPGDFPADRRRFQARGRCSPAFSWWRRARWPAKNSLSVSSRAR